MKRSAYVLAGYTLALLICSSFFFSLYYLFTVSWILGSAVIVGVGMISVLLIKDPENYEVIQEQVTIPKENKVNLFKPLPPMKIAQQLTAELEQN